MSKLSQMFKDTDASQKTSKPAPSIDSNPLLCKYQAALVKEYRGETNDVIKAVQSATKHLQQNPR